LFYAVLAFLFLGDRNIEVEVEVGTVRGRPGKRPSHPLFVRLQLGEGRPRYRRQRYVVVRQVDDEAVERVRDRRTGRAPGLVVGPEHKVIDEKLRATAEKSRQRGAAFIGLEAIRLVDPDPRQLLPPLRQLVAPPRQLLLRREAVASPRQPLFARPGLVCGYLLGHRSSLQFVAASVLVVKKIRTGYRAVGVTSVAGFRWTPARKFGAARSGGRRIRAGGRRFAGRKSASA